MAGSAVLTIVESSVCMKKPVATSHSITVSERDEGVVLVGLGGVETDMGRWRAGWVAGSGHCRENGRAVQSVGMRGGCASFASGAA